MIGTIVKYLYSSLIYPRLKSYVESTDNQWDDTVLEFVDEVVEILIDRLNAIQISLYKDQENAKKVA